LADALRGSPEPNHRALLKLHLERLKLLDQQIDQLSQLPGQAPHQEANSPAEGKASESTPTSAILCGADSMPIGHFGQLHHRIPMLLQRCGAPLVRGLPKVM
jgi:hypothetical protein